jgi:hypothetical protein
MLATTLTVGDHTLSNRAKSLCSSNGGENALMLEQRDDLVAKQDKRSIY